MELAFQKMLDYKDWGTWNMPLWRHKSRSAKISYVENYLSNRVDVSLILTRRYIFLKSFEGSTFIYLYSTLTIPNAEKYVSHVFLKRLWWWYKIWWVNYIIYNPACSPCSMHFDFITIACSHAQENFLPNCIATH